MSVNKVILVGNLGADPEVRHFENGAVAKFSIATTERYKNKEGETVSQTEWHRLEVWNGLAKVAEQYLKKGSQIYVEGKLKTEEYTDKDGIVRRPTIIRVLNLTMLGGRPQEGQAQNQQQQAPTEAITPDTVDDAEGGEELPF